MALATSDSSANHGTLNGLGLQNPRLEGLSVVPASCGFEGGDEFFSGLVGFDDSVEPASGGGVADVGLFGVAGVDGG